MNKYIILADQLLGVGMQSINAIVSLGTSYFSDKHCSYCKHIGRVVAISAALAFISLLFCVFNSLINFSKSPEGRRHEQGVCDRMITQQYVNGKRYRCNVPSEQKDKTVNPRYEHKGRSV